MPSTVSGSCHCGNLSFELRTETPPDQIRARACDCSFCRSHGAKNWSDPNGSAVIHVSDAKRLQTYRFALKTADFYICMTCGAYLGAVMSDDEGTWSTVNLRLTGLPVEEEVASFGAEQTNERVARRKRLWTPTIIQIKTRGK